MEDPDFELHRFVFDNDIKSISYQLNQRNKADQLINLKDKHGK